MHKIIITTIAIAFAGQAYAADPLKTVANALECKSDNGVAGAMKALNIKQETNDYAYAPPPAGLKTVYGLPVAGLNMFANPDFGGVFKTLFADGVTEEQVAKVAKIKKSNNQWLLRDVKMKGASATLTIHTLKGGVVLNCGISN
jgi:hypothetical protein